MDGIFPVQKQGKDFFGGCARCILVQKGVFPLVKKELKRLNRRELVDVIYQMKKNEEEMRHKIAELEEALQDKRVRISMAGSVAEAATDVTHILFAAQKTADLYLYEISCRKEETEKQCADMLEEARQTVKNLLEAGEKQYAELNARYQMTQQKWQLLQQEVQLLEDAKKSGSCED